MQVLDPTEELDLESVSGHVRTPLRGLSIRCGWCKGPRNCKEASEDEGGRRW